MLKELVKRNMNQGHYKVQFDGKGLPSGIYLYKIEMGDYSETGFSLNRTFNS